jgi:hypothetical protein
MKNQTLVIMSVLVMLGVATLMMLNYAPNIALSPSAPDATAAGLPPLEVRGMAVVHEGKPFTLNFDQQKLANDAISRAVKVKKSDYSKSKDPLNFDKIVIYRFNAPDLDLIPIQYAEKNLVFEVPALSSDSYFLELSGGSLKNMINHSFDQ